MRRWGQAETCNSKPKVTECSILLVRLSVDPMIRTPRAVMWIGLRRGIRQKSADAGFQ
jgi:hypothetical protein